MAILLDTIKMFIIIKYMHKYVHGYIHAYTYKYSDIIYLSILTYIPII